MGRGRVQAEGNPDAALAAATEYLSERGAQLTPIRRAVLRLLFCESRAIGAYDLVFKYQQELGRRVAPNTIYRALDFLEKYGLAAHLARQRSYVATVSQSQRAPSTIFFTCTHCGRFTERDEIAVEQAVRRAADEIGLVVARRAIEVEGNCRQCAVNPRTATTPHRGSNRRFAKRKSPS